MSDDRTQLMSRDDAGRPGDQDSGKRPRWVLLLLPVALTLAIGIGVGGWVAYKDDQKSDAVRAADKIGAEYLSEVATFQDRIAAALAKVDSANPVALRKVLKSQLRDLPKLPATSNRASDKSETYQRAESAQATLLDPYRTLERALKSAEARKKFVDAGVQALGLDPTKLVSSTSLESSSELRGRLIPTFNAERAKFVAIAVPKGGQECAQAVTASLDQVISEATKLADSIDAQRSYSTKLGTGSPAAAKALDGCRTRFDGDLAEALDAVPGRAE